MNARFGVGHPLVRSASLALVSLATAFAFARVFSDGGFALTLLVAALLPHTVGAVGRMRAWSTFATATLATLATGIALVWISAGETTAYGIPTPATAGRMVHLVDVGWHVFRIGVAPVRSTTGVVLLCAVAVAVAALIADAVARRPDVTLGALAPTLVVFVLVGTLGSGHLRYLTTIVYVAAALTALAIANAARVESHRTWFTGRRLSSDAATIRSAAAVGGIALLAALVITPLVPGVDNPPLLRYRNASGGSGGGGFDDYTSISPLVDLRARLRERTNVELFRVQSSERLSWRLVALDRFNGTTWSLTSEARDAATLFPNRVRRDAVRQHYTISSLSDRWLPAAYRPVSTTVTDAKAIPESLTLVAPSQVTGLDYQVQSLVEQPPTPAEIIATATGRLPASVGGALALPSGFLEAHQGVINAIVRDAATPWDRAVALRDFFTDGAFTYDLDPRLGDGTDAIDTFLRTRRGFCQQFAATFAAFGRAAGLPTRVVVGFTPGTYDELNDEYVVHGRDAHAWVEVYFAGLGWRTFDPTPAGPLPGQADLRPATGSTGTATTTTPTTAPDTSATSTGRPSTGTPRVRESDPLISTGSGTGGSGWSVRTILLVVLLAAAGVFAAVWALLRLLGPRRRRSRRRRAPDPAHRIGGAWSETLDECARAGYPPSPALTPAEQIRSLDRRGVPRGALPALRDLAELHAEQEFSGRVPDAEAPTRAWTAAEAVREALRAETPAPKRARQLVQATFGAAPPAPDDA